MHCFGKSELGVSWQVAVAGKARHPSAGDGGHGTVAGGDFADAVITAVGNVDIAAGVDKNAGRAVQLGRNGQRVIA